MKLHPLKKILFCFGGLLILSAIYLYIISIDKPYVMSDSLQMAGHSVPHEQNAFFLINEASGSIVLNAEDVVQINKNELNLNFADSVLARNRASLDSFNKASRLNNFQFPAAFVIKNEKKINLRNWTLLAELLLLHSYYLANTNKDSAALECAFNLFKTGDFIQKGNGPLIHYTVGSVFRLYGFKAAAFVLQKNASHLDFVRNGEAGIKKYCFSPAGLVQSLKVEHHSNCLNVDEVDSSSENNFSKKLFFKPNDSKRLFDETAMFVINNLNYDYQHALKDISGETGFIPERYSSSFPFENSAGKELFDMSKFSIEVLFNKISKEKFSCNASVLLVSILKYKKSKGDIPKKTAHLVPDYLPSIPLDPYDGKPLRYSHEYRIIYSIGSDLVDKGNDEGLKLFIK
ncbi:MAG: hypothetical protein GY754_22455 [bacterium]|nr:hypothetical protein [bacterium]